MVHALTGWVFLAAGLSLVLVRWRHRQQASARNYLAQDDEVAKSELLLEAEMVVPIGQVRSIFANKRGVPRQGQYARSTRARIELFPELISGDSLDGLN